MAGDFFVGAGRPSIVPSPGTATQRRDSELPPGLRPLPLPWGKLKSQPLTPGCRCNSAEPRRV